ncbi:AsmA family protein [Vibrio rarus]|uniref:AsmA family protein n=1 Tax=Vibrio rarus TaxID=413403 RepID=UPI0021C40CA6|nr:AsmA family protein [Vibrio rarus]
MKKLSLFIITPIVLIVLTVVALLVFVDPNQFKPLLVEQTKKQTHLDLTIEGDISWQFFPSIGFSLGKSTLSNPAGFSAPNMLKVDQVGLDISVLPLLSKELRIGNVTLLGAQFYMETHADGSSNLDALTASQSSSTAKDDANSTATDTATTTDGEAQPWTVSVAGLNIDNALLEIKDDQAKLYTKLEKVNVQVADFAFDQWTPLSFSFSGVNNQQNFAITGKASAKTDAKFTDYQVKDIELSGHFSQPDVDLTSFKLNVDTFKLDSWAKVSLLAKGEAAGNAFDITSATQVLLERDLSTFAIKDFTLQTPLTGKDIAIKSFSLDVSSFKFAQPSSFKMAVDGHAAGLDSQLTMTGSVLLDEALSKVKVNQLNAQGKLAGESLPQNPIAVDLKSNIDFDLTTNTLSLLLNTLSLNDLQLDGSSSVVLSAIPKVRFKLHSPMINLDQWTGNTDPNATESSSANTASSSANTAQKAASQEPNLSVLKTLDVAGSIRIDKFQASNAKLQNTFADIAIKDGIFNLRTLTANLYQGSIKAKAQLNGQQAVPRYDIDAKVNNVKVGPLLVDVADNNTLEGTGNITLDLTGKSLIPDELKKHLAGTVVVKFADGAINGINVAQIIRTNYAKFKGEKVPAETQAKKTDFSAMDATVKLNKGVATLSNVSVQSPLLRIKASGDANYLNETMDILSKTSVVGSLEGQGGKSIDDLTDVTIPLRIKGAWASPQFSLDLAALQQQELERNKKKLEEKAKKEAERGLKKLFGDKGGDEDVKKMTDSLLKKLF